MLSFYPVFSGPKDIASALWSYAWGIEGMHFTVPKLFSVPGLNEREADSSIPLNEDENNEGYERERLFI